MEQIYLLDLLFAITELGVIVLVFWWPILELENFSRGEKTHNTLPMLLSEWLSWVIHFECDFLLTNFFGESLLVLVFFMITGKFNIGWLNESPIFQKLNGIFQANISWVICWSWNHNDWSSLLAATSMIIVVSHSQNLVKEWSFFQSFINVDIC